MILPAKHSLVFSLQAQPYPEVPTLNLFDLFFIVLDDKIDCSVVVAPVLTISLFRKEQKYTLTCTYDV